MLKKRARKLDKIVSEKLDFIHFHSTTMACYHILKSTSVNIFIQGLNMIVPKMNAFWCNYYGTNENTVKAYLCVADELFDVAIREKVYTMIE